MPVDPAWPHSGLGLGTGSIPNRAVRSIPSTPFPANRCPAPWSRPGHKYQPVSCRSPFPPSRPLPLLPFLRFCPSHFRRIPCDLLPFFLGQLLQSGFDRLAAQCGEIFGQLLVDHSTIITYSAAEHGRVPLPCQSIRSVPSAPRSRHFTSWSSMTLTPLRRNCHSTISRWFSGSRRGFLGFQYPLFGKTC